jgi:enamine deaminase RidA (YjgF/YER057c/UK114 family)
MRKTVVLPTWRESPSEELAAPNSAYATITDHDTHRRVAFSGALAVEGDVSDQVRAIFARRREALADFGGSMDDVVVTRYFVREDHLDRETQAAIHEARDEFFEHPHYPASTMVGVGSLLAEDALVEIELEAEIPEGAWDASVLTEDDT